jgi:hypothetical protein
MGIYAMEFKSDDTVIGANNHIKAKTEKEAVIKFLKYLRVKEELKKGEKREPYKDKDGKWRIILFKKDGKYILDKKEIKVMTQKDYNKKIEKEWLKFKATGKTMKKFFSKGKI